MIVAIVAAEVGFWVLLLGGLTLRYVVRARRAGGWVLAAVPVVDALLLVFVTIDVARGAEPTRGHAIAAVYLGFTVAFGHTLVRAADVRFRQWFADGPAPVKPAKGSREQVRALWAEWLRVVLAVAVASVGIGGLIRAADRELPATLDAVFRDPLWGTIAQLVVVCGVWFLAGPAFAGRGRAASSA